MVEPLSCKYCESSFRDGDFVAYEAQDRLFHTIIRRLDQEPMSCLLANVMYGDRQNGMSFGNVGVHYNGRLYSQDEIGKLQNASELTVDFNDDNNGDKLVGDLEGIAKRKPLFPKLTLKERIFGVK